ncbi:MAG: hypoxanthine phosphoribosyltransferase [Alphaproteobacteria bacterium]|nr:hypoxanthine phosphoribosyltransferase [Alphaproteobacteria bacterium]
MTFSPEPVSVLFTEQQIAERNAELAREIAEAVPPGLFLVALLRGSFMFAADLMRALHHIGVHPQLDFITLSSYGGGMKSSGNVTLHQGLTEDIAGRPVVLVDDILESGRTLFFAKQLLLGLGAKEVRIAALLEKPGHRAVQIDADFVGFVCPDKFLVGYGLDYGNYYRELPFIGYLSR